MPRQTTLTAPTAGSGSGRKPITGTGKSGPLEIMLKADLARWVEHIPHPIKLVRKVEAKKNRAA